LESNKKFIISPEIQKFNKFVPRLKIAVLASGEGTNFQELINLSRSNELDIDLRILITNNEKAGCLRRAIKFNIHHEVLIQSSFKNKYDFEEKIIETLIKNEIELIVMAGWMTIISEKFVESFKNRIINIHPSILPSFKGKNSVEDALNNGSLITGCSVHFVVPEVDSGSLIIQGAVPIEKGDNIFSLTKKIHEIEHKILPIGISEAGLIIRDIKDKD
tara:strand:- start:127 stop:780 length:654 start_codon:yes stop_codon:yes gene_type:complete